VYNFDSMPELPEVETIVQQLNSKVKGKLVNNISINNSIVDSKLKEIVPFKIKNVFRRGKSIVFELGNEKFILTHLRMTGYFCYNQEKNFQVAKFTFSDNSFLTHNSIRKFGGMKLVSKETLDKEFSKLGVEPLSKEFDLNYFKTIIDKKKNSNIKTTLLDQSLIAGIGNIYAQEMLYHSAINPHRKSGSLNGIEIKKLSLEIVRVLSLAIKHKGSTVDNYTNMEGAGNFQNIISVYNQSFCPLEHQIKKVSIGGRGTSYCPVCQK
jgi:formamidopyrimidine-DNA glycosylase